MEDVFGMEDPESKEELCEPVANYLFAETLVVFLESLEVGGEITLCIVLCVP